MSTKLVGILFISTLLAILTTAAALILGSGILAALLIYWIVGSTPLLVLLLHAFWDLRRD